MYKGNRRFRIITLLIGTILLGAGLLACVTVPNVQEPEEVSVSFVFIGRHDSVCLSGDFNSWSPESHCLKRRGDEWSIQLVLAPGRYRYGFVIDKRDWACDPEALIQEDDGYGKQNSVFLIDPAVTKRLPAP